MRNSKIPLHIKQAAYAEYKNNVKVVDILNKYNICFGTLYTFIHKQDQIAKTFIDNQSDTISISNSNSNSKTNSKTKSKTNTKTKTKTKTKTNKQIGGEFNGNSSILSIDDALLELENL